VAVGKAELSVFPRHHRPLVLFEKVMTISGIATNDNCVAGESALVQQLSTAIFSEDDLHELVKAENNYLTFLIRDLSFTDWNKARWMCRTGIAAHRPQNDKWEMSNDKWKIFFATSQSGRIQATLAARL
jgi:hypothetical protein